MISKLLQSVLNYCIYQEYTALNGKNPVLIHHKASFDGTDHPHPPNTLEAVKACIEAQAAIIEIDVLALRETDYLVLHDQTLDKETTGNGHVGNLSGETARQLHLKHHPAYAVPLLSDVIQAIGEASYPVKLHVDFKNVNPFPVDEPLERLASLLAPISDQVIVSSMADWQLRKLNRIAPELEIGFDPAMYLAHYTDEASEHDWPPYKRGAYGLFDDSLIAREAIWSKADYLRDRCETLMNQLPVATILFINYLLLLESLDAGFDWAAHLHSNGKKLAAWTMDAPKGNEAAIQVAAMGVDYLTTNTPQALRRVISP